MKKTNTKYPWVISIVIILRHWSNFALANYVFRVLVNKRVESLDLCAQISTKRSL